MLIVTTRVVNWTKPRKRRTLEPSRLAPEAATRVVSAMADEFGIEMDTAPFAADLARAAKYHPRLIELAVGKLNYLTSDDILRELGDLKSHDAEQALTEMIGMTVEQMAARDPPAPGTLRRLAVCRGGFSYEAAKAISGIEDEDALRARLKTLIDHRFVHFDGKRYSIDDLVALAVVADDGEDENARRAHFDYYDEQMRKVINEPSQTNLRNEEADS